MPAPAGSILFTLHAPRVVLLGNVFSPKECAALVDSCRGQMSRTAHRGDDGTDQSNPRRTSQETCFTRRGSTPLMARLDQRLADLTNHPVEHGEPLQVFRYGPGDEYEEHQDYFSPEELRADAELIQGGQRVATVMVYLNTVEGGGGTRFPTLGLNVGAQQGHALFFAYASGGQVDPRTLHAGAPVTDGEKWIAVKWVREGPWAMRT